MYIGRDDIAYIRESDIIRIRLRELEEQKTEFISIASHQLRTPLAIIRGYIELIESGAYGNIQTELSDVIQKISQKNEELIDLVESLLQIAEIDQDSLVLRKQTCDVLHIIKEATHALQGEMQKNSIELHVDIPDGSLYVDIDKDAFSIACTNILENAIKYAPQTQITLRVDITQTHIEIECIDKGIGFEIDEAKYIFSKFYRAKGARNAAVKGTGLGLYIARSIVELHGGYIHAKSPGVGAGSTFTIYLPIKNTEYNLYSN